MGHECGKHGVVSILSEDGVTIDPTSIHKSLKFRPGSLGCDNDWIGTSWFVLLTSTSLKSLPVLSECNSHHGPVPPAHWPLVRLCEVNSVLAPPVFLSSLRAFSALGTFQAAKRWVLEMWGSWLPGVSLSREEPVGNAPLLHPPGWQFWVLFYVVS